MSDLVYDCDAWERYPQHRWIFNKLELSLKLNYCAGPGGTSVPEDGEYVARPIYNLSGMGVGARRVYLKRKDYKTVGPGEFWCQFFYGPNITIDYCWDKVDGKTVLRPKFAAQGFRTSKHLYRFSAWKKIDPPIYNLPEWINTLQDVPYFNIEFIDEKIIEIHLRTVMDFPNNTTNIIPIWSDMDLDECKGFERSGYTMYTNFDDADGHLEVKRIGFYVR